MLCNLIVAFSNLIGLYYVYDVPPGENNKYFILFPMLASFFYHLAETKHQLPGIYPFNLYTKELLWCDRFFAVVSAVIVFYKMSYQTMSYTFWIVGIVGLFCLLFSEIDVVRAKVKSREPIVSKINFVISHCIWHFSAFRSLAIVI